MNKKKSVNKKKKQLQIKANLDKFLINLLLIVKAKRSISYATSYIYFDSKKKEIVATDGHQLIVITMKAPPLIFDLESGIYEVLGNTILKKEKGIPFPKYEELILSIKKRKEVCFNNNIYIGIAHCMIINKVALNIQLYEKVLRKLSAISSTTWQFFNNSPAEAVLVIGETNKYIIKYVMMPFNLGRE